MTTPDWCDIKRFELDSGCNFNRTTGTTFYTLTNNYLDVFFFEMVSWVFMLVLILYDMFMIDIHTVLLIIYCFLYIFDIITGFLFFNNILNIKINLFTRLIFLILYWRYSRLIILTFLYYLYKVRMIFYLLIFCIVFLAMVFNIIFFETPIENSPLIHSRLNFETFYGSLFSTYTIFTQENVINMFNQNMKYHSAYLTILLPIIFILYYIILAFLIGVLTYFYNKILRREIRNMEHFDKFKKVFYYFKDKDGIVSYQKINMFISIFYKDPHNIDFNRINLQSLNREQRKTIMDLQEDKMTRMSITRFRKREKLLKSKKNILKINIKNFLITQNISKNLMNSEILLSIESFWLLMIQS